MTSFDELPKTYVTLSFAGDRLDPADISAILPVAPKRAHRKGEVFGAGQRAGDLTGRTGIWYFDTRDLPSSDLAEHLGRIVNLLDSARVSRLRDVMDKEGAAAHVSCFWYGKPGMPEPTVPHEILAVLDRLPADVELDFHTA